MRLASRSGLIATTLAVAAIAIPSVAQAGDVSAGKTPDPCRSAAAQCLYGLPHASGSFAPALTSVATATPDPCRSAAAQCLFGLPHATGSFAPALTSVATATPDSCRNAAAQCLYGLPHATGSFAPASTVTSASGNGFDYGDAGVGAGMATGLALLIAAGTLSIRRRGQARHA